MNNKPSTVPLDTKIPNFNFDDGDREETAEYIHFPWINLKLDWFRKAAPAVEENDSEDEGIDDYKLGGYHPVHIGLVFTIGEMFLTLNIERFCLKDTLLFKNWAGVTSLLCGSVKISNMTLMLL